MIGLARPVETLLAMVALVVALPLLLVAAAAFFLEARCSPVFRQMRVGRNGSLFPMFKLRTMRSYQDPLAIGDDGQVTFVGKFLRTLRIDELPQLLNVIIGDMRLVGHRPETVNHREAFLKLAPALRAQPPGLTSPGSICFRSEAALLQANADPEGFYLKSVLPAKICIDTAYQAERTAVSDLRILGHTLTSIAFSRSTIRADDLARPQDFACAQKLLRSSCSAE